MTGSQYTPSDAAIAHIQHSEPDKVLPDTAHGRQALGTSHATRRVRGRQKNHHVTINVLYKLASHLEFRPRLFCLFLSYHNLYPTPPTYRVCCLVLALIASHTYIKEFSLVYTKWHPRSVDSEQ